MGITLEQLRRSIRDIQDFPKAGILFKDITPLLQSPDLFKSSVERLAGPFRGKGITHVASVESRGFIFGAPVAYLLGAAFVPIRKVGKLPAEKIYAEYALEYGTATLEIHVDAVEAGQRVLIVDDVLATGGTADAAGRLVTRQGASLLGYAFVIELGFLGGRGRLGGAPVQALVSF